MPPSLWHDEPLLFWMHLLKANLISGVNDSELTTATTTAWGVTHPAAKIGGGFIAGTGNGNPAASSPAAAGTGVQGTLLVLISQPHADLYTPGTATILTPGRAAQIDRKMDDGLPASGAVQGGGNAANCFGSAPYAYNEAITTKDCALVFKIN